MSSPAIEVENLGKRYRIGERSSYRTLRESLAGAVRAPFRRREKAEIWALRELDFTVAPGEVMGVIGRNGAGKSTLLKILSRITEPTTGEARIHGRVSSLLEVGTGFHPELTGRENVFLNGAILGMKRAEIRRKFDPIVEFAGVETFLDTPVKRYSSGMVVRLAFAVAAHLEPEILVIDEVLAVGDAAFQRKCLGKMSEVAGAGRTVLFVSHNMAAVQNLCSRALVLAGGRKTFDGATSEAIRAYLAELSAQGSDNDLTDHPERRGSPHGRLTRIRFEDDAGREVSDVAMGEALTVVLDFEVARPLDGLNFAIAFDDHMAQRVLRCQADEVVTGTLPGCERGGRVRCRIPDLPLVAGRYAVTLGMASANAGSVDWIANAAAVSVTEGDVFGTGKVPASPATLVVTASQWSFECR